MRDTYKYPRPSWSCNAPRCCNSCLMMLRNSRPRNAAATLQLCCNCCFPGPTTFTPARLSNVGFVSCNRLHLLLPAPTGFRGHATLLQRSRALQSGATQRSCNAPGRCNAASRATQRSCNAPGCCNSCLQGHAMLQQRCNCRFPGPTTFTPARLSNLGLVSCNCLHLLLPAPATACYRLHLLPVLPVTARPCNAAARACNAAA